MMRILMISWEFPPNVIGGIGRHVAELTPELGGLATDDGPITIDVLTLNYTGGAHEEQVTPYVRVHRIDMPPMDPRDLYNSVIANNTAFIEKANALWQQQPYDLIHIHDWLTGMAGILLKHRWKTPLIATIHATERGRHQGFVPSNTSAQIDQLEWRICFEAWRIIVCSDYMRQELHNYFGTPFDKQEIIVNGIQINERQLASPEKLHALRQQYATNGERLLFFVGRVSHEKGLHLLMRAMPRILADHPQTRLLVAGRNGSKMWPLAYELNVEKAVNFLDYISDEQRDSLYQIVEAAIFPSLYEPFGIVALEAMALDCNVIASDVGGLGEVVKHEENGLTVLPNDPLSIVWAVNRLLTDPDAAQLRRERALEEVHTYYQWENIARDTAKLYQRVADERKHIEW